VDQPFEVGEIVWTICPPRDERNGDNLPGYPKNPRLTKIVKTHDRYFGLAYCKKNGQLYAKDQEIIAPRWFLFRSLGEAWLAVAAQLDVWANNQEYQADHARQRAEWIRKKQESLKPKEEAE
jgi:hypothetical protein